MAHCWLYSSAFYWSRIGFARTISVPYRVRNGPALVLNRSYTGPVMVRKWPNVGSMILTYCCPHVIYWSRSRIYFAGDVVPTPDTTSDSFHFQSLVTKEDFSTGYYLLPGQEMTITVLNDPDDDTWTEFEVLLQKSNCCMVLGWREKL